MTEWVDEQAAALLTANPARGITHLLRLADQLIEAGVGPEQALQALVRAAEPRPTVVRQFDLVGGTEWRLDPAVASVLVPLTADFDVEVETVPLPHVRLLCWRESNGIPTDPATAAWLHQLRHDPLDSDAHQAVAEVGGALRRWRVGVPLAAGDVMVIGAAVQARFFPEAAGLGRLVTMASASVVREIESLPQDLLRRAPVLRSEVRRWHDAIATFRPDLSAAWAQLVAALPSGWDEPDGPSVDELMRAGTPLGLVFLGVAGETGSQSGQSVPLAMSAAVAVTGLLALRGMAEIRTSGGIRTARIALRPEVASRWVELQRAGADELLGERRWWDFRAIAVIEDAACLGEWQPGTVPPRLPSLLATVLERGTPVAQIPLDVVADGSLVATGLPDDADIDGLFIVLSGRPDLDPDEQLADAERLANLGLWAAAAEGYEALRVLLSAATEEASEEDPPDERAQVLYILGCLRAQACWLQVAASPGFRPDAALARQRAEDAARAARSVNERWVAALQEPPAGGAGGGGVELARLRAKVVAQLARRIEEDHNGSLIPDIRALGAELRAIDRLICGFPSGV
ncbi:MAG: hypothetical protein ACRDZ8_08350 [Acidimicrobiales bacterium]